MNEKPRSAGRGVGEGGYFGTKNNAQQAMVGCSNQPITCFHNITAAGVLDQGVIVARSPDLMEFPYFEVYYVVMLKTRASPQALITRRNPLLRSICGRICFRPPACHHSNSDRPWPPEYMYGAYQRRSRAASCSGACHPLKFPQHHLRRESNLPAFLVIPSMPVALTNNQHNKDTTTTTTTTTTTATSSNALILPPLTSAPSRRAF